MKQLSFVDLHYLVSEFDVLIDQRVDNFYFENDIFYIRIYCRGLGHKYLTNKISEYIYIGESKEDSSHPSSFIQYLRKYLRNSFVRKIEQIEGERIIKITFEQKIQDKIESFNLYLEIFANGNIILTNSSGVIKNALSRKKFKDRKVMVGDSYELPPKRDLSLVDLDNDILRKELKESDLAIVKFLALKFGMGGKYAEEVCFRLKADKNLPAKEFENVDFLLDVLSELLNMDREAYVKRFSEGISDFYPFKFESEENLEKVLSFNEAVKSYYFTSASETRGDNREKQFDIELKRLENRLKKQKAMLDEVLKSSEEQNAIGNKIYENYTLIEELLGQMNFAAKEKGWDYVEMRIKEDERLRKIVKKLDYKNNEIVLEL